MDSSERLQYLETLRNAAWQRFEGRRAFEWKVAFALWTALLAFSGTTLAGERELVVGGMQTMIAVAIGILVLGLHISFLHGIASRQRKDGGADAFFRAEIAKALNIQVPDAIQKLEEGVGDELWTYSLRFQAGVTLLLAVVAVLSLLFRSAT